MPNIAGILKEEISRLARKEIREQMHALKKASSQHRKDIAELKRQISDLHRRTNAINKQVAGDAPSTITEADAKGIRFTAKGLRSHRKKLGLSAGDYGKLLGVTSQTVYNWERGASRPRTQQLAEIASVRHMGKKEGKMRLEQLARGSRKKPK